MEYDLRLEKPIRFFNRFHEEEIMIIFCKVKNVTDLKTSSGYRFKLDIQRCDFKTGDLVDDVAYAHYGFYKNHKEEIFKCPYYTHCNVLKKKPGMLLEIYALNSRVPLGNFFGLPEILANDEKQIMDVFHDYYRPLNEWLSE